MGLLATLKQALGLQRPLEVQDDDTPLALSEAARSRLAILDPGDGLHVSTSAVPHGRTVIVEEGTLQGPPPPTWEGNPLTASDADVAHTRGLVLDHQADQWTVSVHLEVRARETPNPDGRLYLCDRSLVSGDPLFFTTDDADEAPPLVGNLLQIPHVQSVLLRENTVAIVREVGMSWGPIDQGVDSTLRQHFLYCGHALRSEAVKQLHDPLAQKVLQVLEATVLPAIHKDGGDIELLGVSKGVVRLRMQGACAGCPSSSATLHHGIEATLRKAFPGEIERVEAV